MASDSAAASVILNYNEARIHVFSPFKKTKNKKGEEQFETIPVQLTPGLNTVSKEVFELLCSNYKDEEGNERPVCASFIEMLGDKIRKITETKDVGALRTSEIKEVGLAIELIKGAMFLELVDTLIIGEKRPGVIEAHKGQRAKIVDRLDKIKSAKAA